MDPNEFLTTRFEENQARLKAVAYRMLGSLTEADDAVQEVWLRLGRTDADTVENVGGWLTTVTARVCLDMLRSRKARRENSLDAEETFVPDPVVTADSDFGPEREVLLADSVGLALLVVLEALTPAERLAFVLHDTFGMSFEDIAPLVGRTEAAARQLASRARRRVRGATVTDADLGAQRRVVEAFMAAARSGDFEALVAVLDPDVVLRANGGGGPPVLVRGAETIARRAVSFSRVTATAKVVLVNGAPGLLSRLPDGTVGSVMGFVIRGGKVLEIAVLGDRERLARLDLAGV
jgi:RNA polymerase sigma factor (sigma-70 family)